MRVETIQEMLSQGATEAEAAAALELFRVLRPSLTVSRSNGRIRTTHGDKSILGFYRTVKDLTREV